MSKIDIEKMVNERDVLLDSLSDSKGETVLSPYDKDYQTVIKTVGNLDNSIRDAARLNLETDKLEFERSKSERELESEKLKIDLDRRKAEFEMELERQKFDLDKSRLEFEQLKHTGAMETEKEKVSLERERLKSNEKTTKWTSIVTVIGGVLTAGASVAGTIIKSQYGSKAISEGTRNTFLLDQDKVQSKAAANTMKDVLNFFK